MARATDHFVFKSLQTAGNVIVTRDEDFVVLVTRSGPPPQVLWVRLGNMSNKELEQRLHRTLAECIKLLIEGEAVVELRDAM